MGPGMSRTIQLHGFLVALAVHSTLPGRAVAGGSPVATGARKPRALGAAYAPSARRPAAANRPAPRSALGGSRRTAPLTRAEARLERARDVAARLAASATSAA